MSYKLIVAPHVLRDLEDIDAYIGRELHAPEASRRLLRRILETTERLQEFPFEGERVRFTYLSECEIRRLPVDNYLIFYRVEEPQTVNVLRILYGGTDYINYLKFE